MNGKGNVFHLGICMAGAITAGSYTAGVMDYIIETLERWQREKDDNQAAIDQGMALPFPDAPMYDVKIDVITGASAGGMCAAIATSMFAEGYKAEELANKKSKLYRSWVDLDDDPEIDTISKMLETDDIMTDGFVSMLNSKVIDQISKKMVHTLGKVNLPKYVDNKLDTVLTISNLNGARYAIEFQSYGTIKKHRMSLHRDFMHFKLNETPSNDDFLELDFTNEKHVKTLQESAIATGAFPIGLRPKELTRPAKYYYNQANKIVGVANFAKQGLQIKIDKIAEKDYTSMNVDGGTFNNEPFGETEKILNIKALKNKGEDIESHKTNRAIIMIDPFPSIEDDYEDEDIEPQVAVVAAKILKALRAESLFKTQDLIDSLGNNNYLKFLIIPSKPDTNEPLCCSVLEAFGGFLSRSFREHDYQLGRRNAQQFLRRHFVLPWHSNNKKNNPIHKNWSQNAVNIYQEVDAKNGITYLPIIPDVQKQDKGSAINRPVLVEKYPLGMLKKIKAPLNKRVAAIINSIEKSLKKEPEEHKPAKDPSKKELIVRFFSSTVSLIFRPFSWMLIKIAKYIIRKATVKAIISWMIKDLDRAKLLANYRQGN